MQPNLPAALWLIRHGEGTGNVAREIAEDGGLDLIELAQRDVDVPLSHHGREQARSVGRWLAGLPEPQRPTVALSSPYRRAADTAAEALAGLGSAAARR
ncbi:MAG: phosphoglycerate mutase family protein [Pseudonocardiales bacterium]